jgi:hypothetical protein
MARSVQIALAAGLALLAIAIAVVLSRAPLTVAGTNSIPAHSPVYFASGRAVGCQPSGTIPEGTTAIRVSVSQNTGPKVTLEALSGPFVVARGERQAGWGITETVTVPVKRVARTIPNAKICVAFGRAIEPVQINGVLVRATSAAGPPTADVRFAVEYLRPGSSSWWSLASTVARRMGFGHAPSGTWIVFLLLALSIAIVVLASWLILRELASTRRRAAEAGTTLARIPGPLARVPRAAWICALIACLNAVVWSLKRRKSRCAICASWKFAGIRKPIRSRRRASSGACSTIWRWRWCARAQAAPGWRRPSRRCTTRSRRSPMRSARAARC